MSTIKVDRIHFNKALKLFAWVTVLGAHRMANGRHPSQWIWGLNSHGIQVCLRLQHTQYTILYYNATTAKVDRLPDCQRTVGLYARSLRSNGIPA